MRSTPLASVPLSSISTAPVLLPPLLPTTSHSPILTSEVPAQLPSLPAVTLPLSTPLSTPLRPTSILPTIPTSVPLVSVPVSPPAPRTLRSAPSVSAPLRHSTRSNFGIPYQKKGAYISTPVTDIQTNNYIVPQLRGYVHPCFISSTPKPTVSQTRNTFFSRPAVRPSLPIHTPAVINDDSWFSPPVFSPASVTAAFVASTQPVSPYPLPPPGLERNENIYQLPLPVLQTVAFLADVTNPLDIPAGLHLPTTDLHEVPYLKAFKNPEKYPREALHLSVNKEIDKITTRFKALEVITDPSTQIDSDALFINGILLSKVKYHADGSIDRISSRFALNGTLQKDDEFGEIYAATPDEAAMLCCMSAFQAHAIQHNYVEDLEYASFDVDAAFLHCDLVSKRQIITRLPSNIDHPLAGKLCIVRKSVYGLRQANKAFADDFSQTILKAGFTKCLDPCIYKKIIPVKNGVAKRCYVNTHVDDGQAIFNSRDIYNDLISTLELRYGTLKKQPLTSYTGTIFKFHSNDAFTRTQEGFLLRFLQSINIRGLTSSKVPSKSDLFDDTSASSPCDIKLYRSILGSLIHLLRTRYDAQKEVVHLSAKMSRPTMLDLAKAVLVLRYLSGTPDLGPTYYTKQSSR